MALETERTVAPGERLGRTSAGWSGVANTLLVISLIGAINWGLIGLFNFNLVEAIFGRGVLSRVVYSLVGICGVASLFFLPRLRVLSREGVRRRERTGVTRDTTLEDRSRIRP